jgi:tetratricopeptide (TPR) repeat protein
MRIAKLALISTLLLPAATHLGGCTGPERPLTIVHAAGNEAYVQGRYDAAIAEYAEYIERKPYDAVVRHKLAKAYLGAKQPTLAREHAQVCHDIHPDNVEYAATLAEAMYASDDLDGLFVFLRSQAAERQRPSDQIQLGRYLAKLGTADEAETAFLAAARLDGGRTIEPQRELADFYGAIGATDREIERLRMVIFIRPADPYANARLRELGQVPGPSFALPPR